MSLFKTHFNFVFYLTKGRKLVVLPLGLEMQLDYGMFRTVK